MTFPRSRSRGARGPAEDAPVPEPGPLTALREDGRSGREGRYWVQVAGVRVGAVTVDAIAELGIRVGMDVDAPLLSRLQAAARRVACYDKALETLARRARSSADLQRWLRDREFTADEITPALERLTTLGLLDDLTFARAFARSRAAGKGFGRRRIAAELARKGVPRGVVDEVLAELAEDLDRSEPEAMEAAAEKRARSLASLEPEVAQRRLFGWLVRRGYDGRAASELARRLFPRSRR